MCRKETCDDFDNENDCSNSPGCIDYKLILKGYFSFPFCLKIKLKSEPCFTLQENRCLKEFGCI